MLALVLSGGVWLAVRDGGAEVRAIGADRPAEQGTVTPTEAASPREDGTGAESASPREDAGREQAEALDSLLAESGGTRSGLGPALERLRACTGTSAALATVRQVTDTRRDQVSRLDGLPVDALDGGAALKERLAEALGASLSADERFLAWATGQDGDCREGSTEGADYRDGLSFSEQATAAKKRFLTLWNPLAARYGLPERAEHEI
ncbi:hypothetical protein [Planomonospora sp. ID82291]|uniref:hypothetical protein n=1 Tax=Planomonospora sp. ID82291 TaxID=2738136 RepID=UPI0018C3B8BF|nr:hypothetical protein [Planomonospora sp. ID82291]MBG0815985.1 hypothetical protein [Planomonospora sp. ID82291]